MESAELGCPTGDDDARPNGVPERVEFVRRSLSHRNASSSFAQHEASLMMKLQISQQSGKNPADRYDTVLGDFMLLAPVSLSPSRVSWTSRML